MTRLTAFPDHVLDGDWPLKSLKKYSHSSCVEVSLIAVVVLAQSLGNLTKASHTLSSQHNLYFRSEILSSLNMEKDVFEAEET